MLAIASTQQQKHKETNREKKGGERSLQENLKTVHWIVSWEFLLHTLFSKSFIFLSNTPRQLYVFWCLLTICTNPDTLPKLELPDLCVEIQHLEGVVFSNDRKIDPKNGLWWHWISRIVPSASIAHPLWRTVEGELSGKSHLWGVIPIWIGIGKGKASPGCIGVNVRSDKNCVEKWKRLI